MIFVIHIVVLLSSAAKRVRGFKEHAHSQCADNVKALPRCSPLLFLVAYLSFSRCDEKVHARELIMVADREDLAKNSQIVRNCAPQQKPHHRAN